VLLRSFCGVVVPDLAAAEARDDLLVFRAGDCESSGNDDSPVAFTVDTEGEGDEEVMGGLKRAGALFFLEEVVILSALEEADLNAGRGALSKFRPASAS
jgi:hypothetical protein